MPFAAGGANLMALPASTKRAGAATWSYPVNLAGDTRLFRPDTTVSENGIPVQAVSGREQIGIIESVGVR